MLPAMLTLGMSVGQLPNALMPSVVLDAASTPLTASLVANSAKATSTASSLVAASAEDSPSIHGDPIFKVNGKSTNFWIKAGTMTPLLTWPSHDGLHTLQLSGRTFARKATGDQWFKELVLGRDNETVLTLTAQSNHKSVGPMLVHTSSNTTAVNITVNEAKGQSGGRQWAESVEVKANGICFSVKSASATKFAKGGPQDEFHHLNLEFPHELASGVGATGLFAQLAGIEPMAEATEKLLKRPVTSKQKHQRHARQVARKKQEKHNREIKATRYVDNEHTNPAR